MQRARGAAALLALLAMASTASSAPTAIVIGAGISGLKAALDLATAGVSVTVVEARDRIGGRIWTARDKSGKPIELGAQWIHGSSNVIVDAANAQGWATVQAPRDPTVVYDATSPTTARLVPDSELSAWDKLQADLEAAVEDYEGRSGARRSVQWAIDQFKSGKSDAEKKLIDLIADQLYAQEFGADPSELSLGYFDEGEELSGTDSILTNGYDQFVNWVHKQFVAKGGKVELGKAVTAVKYSRAGVTVTAGGSEYKADFAVVTVPAGVLAASSIAFSPALPAAKRTALRNVGMGVLNKVILSMPPTSSGWSASDWYDRFPLPADNNKWREFYGLKRLTGRDVMVAFNAGAAARYPASDSNATLIADALRVLNAMFPSFGSAPAETWVTRWQDDPWSLGSYSFLKVGARGTERRALAAKVRNQLYFAGEHTSTDYPATVQGAYLSGQAAAAAAVDYWA